MRSYLFKTGLFLLPGGLFLLLNFVVLQRTGELMMLSEIAERQNRNAGSCLYGTAVHDDTFFYKLEGYKYRKPDVAIIGSSRVMQMRDTFFAGSFYNLGGAMSSVNQGEQLFRQMTAFHKPKLLLIGADFWWFNDKVIKANYREDPLPARPRLRLEHLFEPVSFLLHGKMTVRQYAELLFGKSEPCPIGITARFRGTGYGADGSYNYGMLLTGTSPEDADEKFASTIARIERGGNRFEYGDHVNALHIEHFLKLVRESEAQGIPVVMFFPPLSSPVVRKLEEYREHYGYLAELRQTLRDAGVKFIDLEDPSRIASPDCEFVDGFHGGDVTYARVVRVLAREVPAIRPFLDLPAIEEILSRNSGLAALRYSREDAQKETDFLKIGCQKGNP